jgi:hypothetical protein
MDNRGLIRQEEQVAVLAPQVTKQGIDPEIIALSAAIFTAAEGITKEQAVRAAYHFKTTGETLGRDSYIGLEGKVKGQILEGYRAIERNIREDFQTKYRSLTPDECNEHEIQPGDRALVCEVYLLDTWAKCRAMGIPYQPIVGVTVVRKGERLNVPNTKTAHWVLQKQARKDALRQVPGLAVTGEEVTDAAEAAGIKPDVPIGVQLSREQAIALVKASAQSEAPSPAGSRVSLNSRPEGFQGYGDEPESNPAPAVVVAAGHASAAESDAQFTALPSIHDEPHPATKNGNSARLPGVTGVPDWPLRCNAFAQAHKQYRLKGSEMPDFPHILGAISKLSINGQGVTTVTPANVDEVFQRLEARTLSAEADAAMKNG